MPTVKINRDISIRVGQRIRDLRKKRGLTQEKLAELSGIDAKHIQLMESKNPSNARIDTIEAICDAFKIRIIDFFSDDSFVDQKKDFQKVDKKSKILKARSSTKREIIIEDNLCYAIYDENPINRGHIVILSKREIPSYFHTLPEEKKSIWEMIEKVKVFLDKEYKPDGYNIGFNVGESSGQDYPYVEIHIIPRYKNDTRNPRGGIRNVIPDK
ncbi:MAG TPA: HIT domain-containing protein [Leptospiraceae bacterium]|nr:HIT domain-containing protein [Leptospiraceae bacterium]HMW08484.1 HIT domain-containing protein [Leptospiraceae bacterium]HMX33324.1 HIT domain-containing protein [Leptospiraceae bacterium]HMY34069.1 HIT domain-containing protein [Leptospiraceae bacterium]HMZ64586.1 HIT domain-containing protein [Leptospiraceae bacterium]